MIDRTSPTTGILLIMSTFLLAALISAFGQANTAPQVTQPIYVLTTPVPTVPLPTADTRLADENARLRARVAELEAKSSNSTLADVQPVYNVMAQPAQPTPEGAYTAHTTQGDIVIPPDATPVPEGAHYDGPFLQPVVAPVPENTVRYCTGFHDWRDFDAAYETSPACKKP